MSVIAALRISYEEWCHTLPGKPCISTCCASRVKSAAVSKTGKLLSLSLCFGDITEKCMQNTDPTSLLFNILVYNRKVSLSVRIIQWLSRTAEPWVLPAQQQAGVTGPAQCPLYHSHRALPCIWTQAVVAAQGQAIHPSLKGAVCLAGHAALLQAALLSPCSWMGSKAQQKHPHHYPEKSTSSSSTGIFSSEQAKSC